VRLYKLAFQLFKLAPAEPAHHVVFGALRAFMAARPMRALARRLLATRDPILEIEALGERFPGPLGLAAGFDKNAEGPDALTALGFAFIEVGTVTALAQPGNPKPRLFRLPADRALVNRMGFNNHGSERVAARLAAAPPESLVAVNIGKTKITPEEDAPGDYAASARALGPHARFVIINVSSPNTPGLRNLQRAEALAPIITAVRDALAESSPNRRVPLLVKIAPDLADEDVDAVADLALREGLDGIVATNTTIARSGLTSDPADVERIGAGGLSGPVLAPRSLELLARLYRRVGHRLVLVSVGGIETADDAWLRITHGATLLELYTGFIYEGPLVAHAIHAGLADRLRKEGFRDLASAVGSAVETAPRVTPRNSAEP
jgi:dihydroorotate dehydrogenase